MNSRFVSACGALTAATRRDFITGLGGVEGAVLDPLTGQFVFSTFGGGNQVIIVRGTAPPPTCYVNCDNSTTVPILNAGDFSCFINRYAANDTYANCDDSTTPPTLNVLDYLCFLNRYAQGC